MTKVNQQELDELVKRLRQHFAHAIAVTHEDGDIWKTCNEAAEALQSLLVENERLREFVAANDAADKARDDFEDRDGTLEAIDAADKRLAEARTLLGDSQP